MSSLLQDFTGAGVSATPGWYAVATSTGHIGVVKHQQAGTFSLGSGFGTVDQALEITSQDLQLPQLLSSFGPDVQKAFGALGATPSQQTALITQADTAAGKQQEKPNPGSGVPIIGPAIGWLATGFGLFGNNPSQKQTTQLLFGTGGTPTASSGQTPVSTSPTGDASTTTPGVSSSGILSLLGSLTFWKGLGLVLAGGLIIVFAAFEFRNV